LGATNDKNDVPKIREDVDLTKLGLNVEEGFLASRVDGRTTIGELALVVGKPEPEILRVLDRLEKVGVVYYGDDAPTAAPSAKSGADGTIDFGDYIFPVALMQEDNDLSVAERKRIAFFHAHLEKWTHYELLQASRTDDTKAIKRVYFARSKEWHPDRFRRGNLGSFKKMIDDIFKQVQVAYGILSNAEKREAYDEEHVFMVGDDDLAEMLKKQKRRERDAKREEERKARRKAKNPIVKRIAQAQKMYESAQAKRDAGELLDALRAAQTAAAFDSRPEYDALVEELKAAAGEFRVAPYIKRGLARENMTNFREAVEAFEDAVRIAPENGQARVRLAYNLLMCGRDPQDANPHAQKGVQLLPDDPEAHFVLGLCYERGGMAKAAARELSRAVELKPNYKEAKKRLRELKWGF
jgi:tetratricopeptide (TPR) repeat protein